MGRSLGLRLARMGARMVVTGRLLRKGSGYTPANDDSLGQGAGLSPHPLNRLCKSEATLDHGNLTFVTCRSPMFNFRAPIAVLHRITASSLLFT